ncbi:3beta-hydroxysteroid-dehydrogenase/decarboxylase [Cucurbita moschata]|uniref:Reticulon-like protein n=1 Tax=Cucurbita moschata TaxID=3662 RepID=A0A6J1EXD3_CUCMO|nr:3beta-hydroxysteroid-dehydrogenase/decarboxylase [Cucurbita moschata]
MEVDDRFVELNTRTCVVLGGRGFLGRSLVLRLLKLAKWNVRIADSAESLELDPSEQDSLLSDALVAGRASYFHVDVRNKDQIVAALSGSSVVFYMDYEDSHSNDIYLSYMFIVQGAKNVINACRDCKVRRLIFNSSADVIFDGSRDIQNGEEPLAYPRKFEDMLSDLKAQAEALILFANDIDGLLTCALRPSNVFGPEDTRLVPFVVNQAKSGLAKFIIGNGENLSDFTFVENVTHAHICAEEALDFRMVSVAGKAFFITNFKPMKFWEFISLILGGLGYRRPSVKLPFKMVWNVLLFLKWIHEKFGFSRYNHSTWARYIQLATCTRTFNCVAAHKQLGYSPIVSMEEGITLTIESFSHLRKELSLASLTEFTEESKADKLLGGGRVADILLWREEKKSFTCFLASFLLFYWFFLRGGTFISSVAQLLLCIVVVLYGYGFIPTNIYGFPVQKLSATMFGPSDTVVRDSIMGIACLWNRGVHNARSLARGEDWNYFFKAVTFLYVLKLFLSRSLTLLIGMGLVFAFTAFFVYEQYEIEIDGFAKFLFISIMELKSVLASHLPPPLMSSLWCNKLSHQPNEVAMSKR